MSQRRRLAEGRRASKQPIANSDGRSANTSKSSCCTVDLINLIQKHKVPIVTFEHIATDVEMTIQCDAHNNAVVRINSKISSEDKSFQVYKGRILAAPGEKLEDFKIDCIQKLIKEIRILRHAPIEAHPNIIDLAGVFWNKIVADSRDIWVPYRLYEHAPGDIKPANILIYPLGDSSLVAKIGDVDISVCDSDDIGPVPGTPHWAPPESWHGGTISRLQKGDIFSLGLVFWFIFMDGLCPFDDLKKLEQLCSRVDGSSQSPLDIPRLTWPEFKRQEWLPNLATEHCWLKPPLLPLPPEDDEQKSTMQRLFTATLRPDPNRRSLRQVLDALLDLSLAEYQQGHVPSRLHTASVCHVSPLKAMWCHLNFARLDEVRLPIALKHDLLKELKNCSTDTMQPQKRRLDADFRLAICRFIGFGIDRDQLSSLKQFDKLASAGHVTCQAATPRLYTFCDIPLPQRKLCEDWLFQAAINGSWIASEQLSLWNPLRMPRAIEERMSKLGDLPKIAFKSSKQLDFQTLPQELRPRELMIDHVLTFLDSSHRFLYCCQDGDITEQIVQRLFNNISYPFSQHKPSKPDRLSIHHLDSDRIRVSALGRLVQMNHPTALKQFLDLVPLFPWNSHSAQPIRTHPKRSLWITQATADLEDAISFCCQYHNVEGLRIILTKWLDWENQDREICNPDLVSIEKYRSQWLRILLRPASLFDRVGLLGSHPNRRFTRALQYLLTRAPERLRYYLGDKNPLSFTTCLDVMEELLSNSNVLGPAATTEVDTALYDTLLYNRVEMTRSLFEHRERLQISSAIREDHLVDYVRGGVSDDHILTKILTPLGHANNRSYPRGFLFSLMHHRFDICRTILSWSGGEELHKEVKSITHSFSCTPLGHAAYYHHNTHQIPRIEFLLEMGHIYGKPEFVVESEGNVNAINKLLRGDYERHLWSLWHLNSAEVQTVNVLERLLAAYPLTESNHIDHQDSFGFTAIYLAAASHNEMATKWLLQAGANPNIPKFSSGLDVARFPVDALIYASEAAIDMRKIQGKIGKDLYTKRKKGIIRALREAGGIGDVDEFGLARM